MKASGDARQRREWLALRTGAHDDDLLGRYARELVGVDEVLVVDAEVSEASRDVGVLNHRAAGYDNLASARDRGIADLLHAMDMACEGRDDDAALGLRDYVVEVLPHLALGWRERLLEGIRRVREHEVDSIAAKTRQRSEVGRDAVDGRLVELEVSRMQDVAGRTREEDAHRSGNRMVDGEEFRLNAAEFDLLARLYLDELCVLDLMFGKLALDQA